MRKIWVYANFRPLLARDLWTGTLTTAHCAESRLCEYCTSIRAKFLLVHCRRVHFLYGQYYSSCEISYSRQTIVSDVASVVLRDVMLVLHWMNFCDSCVIAAADRINCTYVSSSCFKFSMTFPEHFSSPLLSIFSAILCFQNQSFNVSVFGALALLQ